VKLIPIAGFAPWLEDKSALDAVSPGYPGVCPKIVGVKVKVRATLKTPLDPFL
jgi:hypothetical protein